MLHLAASVPRSWAARHDGARRKQDSKPHLAFDTLGHLLALSVMPASAGNRAKVGHRPDDAGHPPGAKHSLMLLQQRCYSLTECLFQVACRVVEIHSGASRFVITRKAHGPHMRKFGKDTVP